VLKYFISGGLVDLILVWFFYRFLFSNQVKILLMNSLEDVLKVLYGGHETDGLQNWRPDKARLVRHKSTLCGHPIS